MTIAIFENETRGLLAPFPVTEVAGAARPQTPGMPCSTWRSASLTAACDSHTRTVHPRGATDVTCGASPGGQGQT